jgi:hypothetical protein
MAQKQKPVQISAYVDPALKKQLTAVAGRERRSVLDTIEIILEKFLHDGGSLSVKA